MAQYTTNLAANVVYCYKSLSDDIINSIHPFLCLSWKHYTVKCIFAYTGCCLWTCWIFS